MPQFRLLHASDTHISTTPYSAGNRNRILQWLRKLGRFAGLARRMVTSPFLLSHDANVLRAFALYVHVHQKRDALDAIVISGDLSTTGYKPDLKRARAFLEATPKSKAFLAKYSRPTLHGSLPLLNIVPGNHDRYRRVPGVYPPGGTVFDSVFSAPRQPLIGPAGFWNAGQGVEVLRIVCRQGWSLALIGADFTLQRGDRGQRSLGLIPGWYGQGRVYAAQSQTNAPLDDLVAWTKRLKEADKQTLVLWVIHFDPFSTDGTLQLLDSDKLMAAARDEQVVGILAGHTHENKIKPISDGTVVYLSGTTAQCYSPQGNSFQAIEIDQPDDGSPPTIAVTWYRYDGKRRFRRVDRRAWVV